MAERTMIEEWLGQRGTSAVSMDRPPAAPISKRRGSLRTIPLAIFSHHPRSFHADPCGERILPRRYAHLPYDHEPRDYSKRDLRSKEPTPVDARVEKRVDDAENRVEQTCPYKRRKDSSQQNRPPWKHGDDRAV